MKKLKREAFLEGMKEGFGVLLNPFLMPFGKQLAVQETDFRTVSEADKRRQDWNNIRKDIQMVVERYGQSN